MIRIRLCLQCTCGTQQHRFIVSRGAARRLRKIWRESHAGPDCHPVAWGTIVPWPIHRH
ncbi:MAG: hypothetical protein V2A79_19900 [Planctomycetota bacterium]